MILQFASVQENIGVGAQVVTHIDIIRIEETMIIRHTKSIYMVEIQSYVTI
jgi:hypothetical protein